MNNHRLASYPESNGYWSTKPKPPVNPILQRPDERFSSSLKRSYEKSIKTGSAREDVFAHKSCKESGMSNKDFCQQHGIGQAMFYYWQKKLAESQDNTSQSFIPVQVNKYKGHPEMEMYYKRLERENFEQPFQK